MSVTKVSNLGAIQALVARCQFGALQFSVKMDATRPYLQVVASAPCSRTGQARVWSGRKWLLSFHMTQSEIVQTVFKAVLTFVEHEVREQFTFDGYSIFDPHYDVMQLVALRQKGDESLDRREGEPAQAAA